MSTSSHFFVAEAAECSCAPTCEHTVGIESARFVNITPLELSTLWSAVEGIEWDVRMMRLLPIVEAGTIGTRTVHEIPGYMVERFATLAIREMARIIQAWSLTVEMAGRGEEVSFIVIDLVALAAQAQETKRRLFLANQFAAAESATKPEAHRPRR